MDTACVVESEIAAVVCANPFLANIEPITTTKIIIIFGFDLACSTAFLDTIINTLAKTHTTKTNNSATAIINISI